MCPGIFSVDSSFFSQNKVSTSTNQIQKDQKQLIFFLTTFRTHCFAFFVCVLLQHFFMEEEKEEKLAAWRGGATMGRVWISRLPL